MGAAGLSAYSASKHALRGLCDCLRLEVRGRKKREERKKVRNPNFQGLKSLNSSNSSTSLFSHFLFHFPKKPKTPLTQLMPTGVSLHLATPGFVDTPMLRASQAAAVRFCFEWF